MPSAPATWRASSTASVPAALAEPPAELSDLPPRPDAHRHPDDLVARLDQKAAATEESTPPLIPTTMRSADMDRQCSRAKQSP